LSVVPILMAGPLGAAGEDPADEDAPDEPGAEADALGTEAPVPALDAADDAALEPAAGVLTAAELPADVVGVADGGVVAALSVRPEPQAASETARVTAPAAAMNRRDGVLRMEPLSDDPGRDRLWKRRSEHDFLRTRQDSRARAIFWTLPFDVVDSTHARSRLGNT
jgi:hypothetical protein